MQYTNIINEIYKEVNKMLKDILPPTTKRVELHTSENINNKIQEETQSNIEYYKNRNKEEIIFRIKELDKEWDIEEC